MKKQLITWSISILVILITLLVIYAIALWLLFTSFLFSWILNFWLMTCYSMLAALIKPKLDSSYFDVKKFEKGGEIYKYFGVHFYRKILVWVGWEKIRKQGNPIIKDPHSLRIIEYNTRISETGHTMIAFIVFGITIGLSTSLHQAKWLMITNIFLNVYPIMVQRYNRPRLRSVIENLK